MPTLYIKNLLYILIVFQIFSFAIQKSSNNPTIIGGEYIHEYKFDQIEQIHLALTNFYRHSVFYMVLGDKDKTMLRAEIFVQPIRERTVPYQIIFDKVHLIPFNEVVFKQNIKKYNKTINDLEDIISVYVHTYNNVFDAVNIEAPEKLELAKVNCVSFVDWCYKHLVGEQDYKRNNFSIFQKYKKTIEHYYG